MPANRLLYAFVLLALLQVFSATYGLNVPGLSAVCPFLFLGSGIVMGFLLLRLPVLSLRMQPPIKQRLPLFISLTIILIITGYFIGGRVIRTGPLTVEQADMLPIIEVMGKRFLPGDLPDVYAPIPEIWNGIQPIYLPAMWAGFLPAVALGFDLRWITLAGIVLSALLCVYPLTQSFINRRLSIATLTALVMLLAWLYTNPSHNVVRLTEEGIVYFWYCLLVYAVLSRNGWAIGIATALCLLSRYAVVGWLPAIALYWWVAGERRTLAKATISAAVTMLILLLPFGWKPLQLMLSLPSGYITHAQKVWGDFPQHFYHSPGLARFFGREGTTTLHYTLIVSSFLLPLLFTAYALRKRKRATISNVPLALLMVTLTVFYTFMDVPYLYLYYTPVFVSLAVAGFVAAGKFTADKTG